MGTVAGLAEWPDINFVRWSTGDLVDALERLNCQAASERTLLVAAVAAEHLSRRLDAMRGQALERATHVAGAELANPSGLVNAAVEGVDSAAAEVALALALHRREAITLVGEAVSVVQDLPLLWQVVRQGRLAWKIAVVTHDRMSACLSPGTAKWRAVQAVLTGSIHDEAFVADVTKGADQIVVALRALPGEEGEPKLADALALLTKVSVEQGARLSFVGGAGSLFVAEGGPALIDTPEFPDAYKGEAGSHQAILEALRQSPAELDWFYVSPAPAFGSLSRPGRPGGRDLAEDAVPDAEGT